MKRFVMNMLDIDIHKIEIIAENNGCTKSWVYRSLLFAVAKKYKTGFPDDIEIRRPIKFNKPFRQITICMYGEDKAKWFSLARIWKMELSSLIRFALFLYQQGELELNLDSVKTIKDILNSERGKYYQKRKKSASRRCRYLYQTETVLFLKNEFRPKNPKKNLDLMKWGLKNRIYPLNLE